MTCFPDHYRPWLFETMVRLVKGEDEYRGASFDRTPLELVNEIQQELADASNWSYIVWARLEDMKRKLCKVCGWPIIRLPNEPKRDERLCSQCANGVAPAPKPKGKP